MIGKLTACAGNLQAMSAGKFKTSVQEAIWMVVCYCCCWWWWWMRYHLSIFKCCLRCGIEVIEVSPLRSERVGFLP